MGGIPITYLSAFDNGVGCANKKGFPRTRRGRSNYMKMAGVSDGVSDNGGFRIFDRKINVFYI